VFTTFSINGRDYTNYIVGQHDAGLDLTDTDSVTPQFGGSVGLGDGQAWIRDSATNKEMQIPLILSADSTDELHQLVRDMKADLFAGAQVQIQLDQASNPTFFTLETGRLDPEYQFFLHQENRLRAMLHLWTRPYGHTATQRLIASQRFSSTNSAVNSFAATGIIGDHDAFAALRVRVGSQIASSGRLVAYGISRFNAPPKEIDAADLAANAPAASSVTVGASGALGSQYLAIPVGPTIASGLAHRQYVAAAPIGGRSRVFAILRSGLYPPEAMRMYAKDRFGAVLGATVLATQIDQAKWQIVDLGELAHPAQPSGLEGVPSQEVQIIAGGASGASVVASPALHLNALVYLPLEIAAGVLLTDPAGGGAGGGYYNDAFERFTGIVRLENSPNADPGPGLWSKVNGNLAGFAGRLFPCSPTLLGAATGATGFYAIGSGALLTDIDTQMSVAMVGTAGASGAEWELWGKMIAATDGATVGLRAKLVAGPSSNHHLALISHDGAATTLHASKSLAASTASAIMGGQQMKLRLLVEGATAQVWLATGTFPQTALLVAGHANVQMAGNPGLRMQQGGGINGPRIADFSVAVTGASQGANDPRQWFKFESYPQGRVIRGATTFEQDMVGYLRGNFPRVPAVGSPAPSGPARVVVMAGQVDDFLGNDTTDVELYVTEKFDFVR
jgi:hypothetical protein